MKNDEPRELESQRFAAGALPWAMSIDDAAHMVGLSRGQFRRVFIDTKRVTPIHSGKRDRIIDTAELRIAYEKFLEETRTGHN